MLRYAPFYQKIRELVISGEIGNLVSVEANELLSPPHGSYIMRNWVNWNSDISLSVSDDFGINQDLIC